MPGRAVAATKNIAAAKRNKRAAPVMGSSSSYLAAIDHGAPPRAHASGRAAHFQVDRCSIAPARAKLSHIFSARSSMALKRPKGPEGTLVVLEHTSRVLKDNPLGDPHVR